MSQRTELHVFALGGDARDYLVLRDLLVPTLLSLAALKKIRTRLPREPQGLPIGGVDDSLGFRDQYKLISRIAEEGCEEVFPRKLQEK